MTLFLKGKMLSHRDLIDYFKIKKEVGDWWR